jgi:lysyl-tRNA synthetase class I
MPHARDPDPFASRPPVQPLCVACGKAMRLVTARPHHRFINLDDCTYRCECGEEGQYVMAREE